MVMTEGSNIQRVYGEDHCHNLSMAFQKHCPHFANERMTAQERPSLAKHTGSKVLMPHLCHTAFLFAVFLVVPL